MCDTKKCSKCGEVKGLGEFSINKARKNGFEFWCKACKCNQAALWRTRNPDRHALNVQTWQAANPEKVRARNKRRDQRNKSAVAARTRKNTALLTDGYVAARIGLTMDKATPELIALKREQLTIKRMVRTLRKAANQSTGEPQ